MGTPFGPPGPSGPPGGYPTPPLPPPPPVNSPHPPYAALFRPTAPLGGPATTYQYIPTADPPAYVGNPHANDFASVPHANGSDCVAPTPPFFQQDPRYPYSSNPDGIDSHVDQVAAGMPLYNVAPYQVQPVHSLFYLPLPVANSLTAALPVSPFRPPSIPSSDATPANVWATDGTTVAKHAASPSRSTAKRHGSCWSCPVPWSDPCSTRCRSSCAGLAPPGHRSRVDSSLETERSSGGFLLGVELGPVSPHASLVCDH
jgi:hypothetical protein